MGNHEPLGAHQLTGYNHLDGDPQQPDRKYPPPPRYRN